MRILLTFVLAMIVAAAYPHETARAQDSDLKIDINVVLKQANVVFNMDHLAFAGEEPLGLLYMRLMRERFAADKTNWQIYSIFHGPAGYMLLNDDAYNRVRKTHTGNPYKTQIASLQSDGVNFELCGQTARDNKWTNGDLLGGVKVNSGANFRIIQLVQEGFVQIQP